jgi:anaerobic ribonucleoside-triphosphate reductase activating protein
MNILHDSIVDGEGLRTVIFFAGCPHFCQGCHNPESWNISSGREMSMDEILLAIMGNELTQVTLSGGEPFLQAKEVEVLARKIKQAGKNIWCYTGFLYESLIPNPSYRKLLSSIDILVDGKFEMQNRDISLLFKGSSNQRIIDVKRSMIENNIVLYKENQSKVSFQS